MTFLSTIVELVNPSNRFSPSSSLCLLKLWGFALTLTLRAQALGLSPSPLLCLLKLWDFRPHPYFVCSSFGAFAFTLTLSTQALRLSPSPLNSEKFKTLELLHACVDKMFSTNCIVTHSKDSLSYRILKQVIRQKLKFKFAIEHLINKQKMIP